MIEITDEILVAYGDDELDAATAAEVKTALAGDGAARRRLAQLVEAADLARRAFEAPLREEVPEALLRTLEAPPETPLGMPPSAQPGVTDLAAERSRRVATAATVPAAGRNWWRPAAIAALIALIVGFGGGRLIDGMIGGLSPDSHSDLAQADLALAGAVAPNGPLYQALERTPSRQRVSWSGGMVQPLQTIRSGDGRYCREYRVEVDDSGTADTTQGLACRNAAGQWRTLAALAVPTPAGGRTPDAYRPAGAGEADLIDRMLDSLGAWAPLSDGEEDTLIESGWPAR